MKIFSILLTCIRYIVVYFVAVHFTCTSPLSQRIISYVLGSTYLEILRDDLTNIYNYLLCSFQRTALLVYPNINCLSILTLRVDLSKLNNVGDQSVDLV